MRHKAALAVIGCGIMATMPHSMAQQPPLAKPPLGFYRTADSTARTPYDPALPFWDHTGQCTATRVKNKAGVWDFDSVSTCG